MDEENYLGDINLWKRILQDDREALSQLFRKYYKPLLNYGMQLVPREELVKDSIQELFFTIWDSRDRLSEIEHVRSYLYSSIRRTLFRLAEIERVRDNRDRSYSQENDFGVKNVEEHIITEEIRREEQQKLQQAFEALSDSQRETAFLKFYVGLTNDEISEVMGINKQSVYNYIYRAIASMKETLGLSMSA